MYKRDLCCRYFSRIRVESSHPFFAKWLNKGELAGDGQIHYGVADFVPAPGVVKCDERNSTSAEEGMQYRDEVTPKAK